MLNTGRIATEKPGLNLGFPIRFCNGIEIRQPLIGADLVGPGTVHKSFSENSIFTKGKTLRFEDNG